MILEARKMADIFVGNIDLVLLSLGVVPLCSLGDPRGAYCHAAGSKQGWRGQHQWRLLCGALRPGRPALLRSGSSVRGRHSRPLPHPGGHRLSKQRPAGYPARRAQPGEAEEVHDPHRRVQLPLPGPAGHPVSLLHLWTESPQHLGEHLDQRPLSGVQHPLPLQGSCGLFTHWRCYGSKQGYNRNTLSNYTKISSDRRYGCFKWRGQY